MKQFILTVALAALTATAAQAEKRVETVRDTVNNTVKLIELDGDDTLSVTTYEGANAADVELTTKYTVSKDSDDDGNDYFMGINKNAWEWGILIPIVGIVFVFGMPIAIVFFALYFRNKNRRAKYKLAEQMLASGQELPKGFFDELNAHDLRTRGFSNLFLGLGLFILLWALTEEFGVGCIGLLVLCIGLGQLATYYTRDRKKRNTTELPEQQ